jgi:PEP-CTERM motif
MKYILSLALCSLFLCSLVNLAQAQNIPLQNATATLSQTVSGPYLISQAIDGVTNDNLGWAIYSGPPQPQTAVFETVSDSGFIGGSKFTFNLLQNYNNAQSHVIGRFRLSATTDNRSLFADGLATGGDVTANWTVLTPTLATSANGATLTTLLDDSLLASGFLPATDTYTIEAITSLTGVTGFRLELLSDPSLPGNGPGRDGNANIVLSELTVSQSPLAVAAPEPTTLAFLTLGGIFALRRRKSL